MIECRNRGGTFLGLVACMMAVVGCSPEPAQDSVEDGTTKALGESPARTSDLPALLTVMTSRARYDPR